ncbi:DUF2141 domain-containing protein [Cytophagaceae bacterium DM2B3-1]|uniref:DUF2141 domain-containing protein n=1 Tax=Xanthocytophaga flava TaxID=3048013 RepID=A0ABT7CF14_9BACT|nr:DUF2141 domain-containing protein [Xanthocytophaga flavus]MDJ1492332.1 DUF2141 domain-containing protein [Xanthocytophaga flavus]
MESSIHITVVNLRNTQGHVLLSVFKSEDGFPNNPAKAVKLIKSKIIGDKAEIVLDNMPDGDYAISVLHDENDNGKMDTGAFGIPKEGYGASNDAKAVLGPPSYKDAHFKHQQSTSLKIKMKYF